MSANGVLIPVSANAKATTPDASKYTIAGDLDLRVQFSMPDWTPAAAAHVIHHGAGGVSSGWALRLDSTFGTLSFLWSENGSTLEAMTSSVATGITDGEPKWVRVTHDVDNGSGGNDVKFYLSDTNGSYSQLGSTQTEAGSTSHVTSEVEVRLGNRDPDTTNGFGGTIFAVEIRDGIDGTVVANPDFVNDPAISASRVVDALGNVWTLHGDAALVDHFKPAAFGLAS